MNYRILSLYLGHICIGLGAAVLPAAAWAAYFREWSALLALVESAAITAAFGLLLRAAGHGAEKRIFEREALALVGLTWIAACAFGALPFVLHGDLGPNDAFFESVSGFTTTGSTVIVDIEGVDRSILFWRSFTHWLGGIGIVIMFIAVLPYFGAGGKLLVKSEATGPASSLILPRFRSSALLIFKVYAVLTIINTVLLLLAGLDLHESLCHAFGALATGGFSTRQASIGAYNSLPVEIITIAFMVIGGTNFALFAEMWLGNWKVFWRSEEFRLYVGLLLFVVVTVAINLTGVSAPFPHEGESFQPVPEPKLYEFSQALRVASFQVASCATDTGYVTDDFDLWPNYARMALVLVMCLGGCAGSTAGGIKMVRILMYTKLGYIRMYNTFRPKTVRPLRLDGEIIEEDTQHRAFTFLLLYLGWFAFGCLFMSMMGLPFDSAFSSMTACINNCGPGLEHVGAIRDYHLIHPVGIAFLSATMLVGRLELVPMLVLLAPGFWRR